MMETLRPQNLFSLDGKVAFVTGAAQGIGYSLSRGLAAAGATVMLADRNSAVEERAQELRKLGCNAHAMVLDITDSSAARRAIQTTVATLGSLDILVNNAAILLRKPLLELEISEWQSVIDVNLTACFVMAQEAAKVMTPKGEGRIINLGSIAGLVAKPQIAAYVAAKGAIAAFTRALASELVGSRITANAIAPGFMITEMSQAKEGAYYRYICETVPARRWGNPEDLCGVAILLASQAGAYINGQVIYVDGGFTAVMK